MKKTIIHNAQILTMVDDLNTQDHPSAIFVDQDKIIALGSDEDIFAYKTNNTKVIDADGAALMPGFVESHMHIFPGAASLNVLPLFTVEGFDDLKTAIQKFSKTRPDDPLLICQGAQYSVLGEGKSLNRHILDEILSDRPLFIQSADFHNGWANSIALEQAGIMQGYDAGENSTVELDEDGIATGVLIEHAAAAPIIALSATKGREMSGLEGYEPKATKAEREFDKKLLKQGLDHCAKAGITTIINKDGNLYQMELLKELEDEGALKCRVQLPYHFLPNRDLSELENAEIMRESLNSDKLWCNQVKLFIDGVLDMHTAFRLNDYPNKNGQKGKPLHEIERFNQINQVIDKMGFQIAVHAIGDGAVNAVFNAYEFAQNENRTRDSRHRIEHIELIDPNDVKRFKELGVIASMQPVHPPGCGDYPLEPTISIIGEKEWQNAYVWRSIKDAGAHLCFASDWPIAHVEPLIGIRSAMDREVWRSDLQDERLSLYETLQAYTSEGAYACHHENEFGQIKVGMKADLVLLNQKIDIENYNKAAFQNIEVAMTMCDGEITYKKEG